MGLREFRLNILLSDPHQSEDQVVKSRGGQQEQQDGEEQHPDEELKQRKHLNEEHLLSLGL